MTGNKLHGSRSLPPMDRVAKNMGKDESAPAGVSSRAGRGQQWPQPRVWERLVGRDCSKERGQAVAARRSHLPAGNAAWCWLAGSAAYDIADTCAATPCMLCECVRVCEHV